MGSYILPFYLFTIFTVSLCLVSVILYLFTFTTNIENHHVSRVFALASTETCIWRRKKCMFLELCAHCINGKTYMFEGFLQFVMQNLPVC